MGIGSIEYLIGVIIVLGVFLWRFSQVPTSPSGPVDSAGKITKLIKWIGLGQRYVCDLSPPPRANTTLLKYRLYQFTYAVIGLMTYLAILKIPGLMNEVVKSIELLDHTVDYNTDIMSGAGPVLIAFFTTAVLPRIPPISAWDAAIRSMLYERAAIPAQQLRERNRLKNAAYVADPGMLDSVRTDLEAEGFNPADIKYNDSNPTVQSLWAKASLLIKGLGQWQEADKYKRAFAILKERDGIKLSVMAVSENYETLKGDAKECFRSMREAPDDRETSARQDSFRKNCEGLLEQIYDLLSRVSLHAHYSDSERVKAMNQLGFCITLDDVMPIPDHNDLLWLALILGVVFVWPLSFHTGLGKAIMIGSIMYITGLTPLVLMSKFPRLAKRRPDGVPPIAFPILSAGVSMFMGLLISVGYHSAVNMDLTAGWEHYTSRGYPWALLCGLVTVLIAWRMQRGEYPEISELHGIARYRLWGNFADAVIFMVGSSLLMVILVLPLLHAHVGGNGYIFLFSLPVIASSAVGFFIPTWYRAQVRRLGRDRRKSGAAARAMFQQKIYETTKSRAVG